MKKIEAIIRTSKFEDVKDALAEKHVNFFTFYEVKGYGHQKSEATVYRGAVYDVGYIGRMKLEIILSEHVVDDAIKAIRSAAHTGDNGDGLVMVSDLDEVLNIRSGARDSDAINA
ncbi:P-II family nitrogen regulator [Portibacter marinus]|uniref:P-II family nitrogen regulator n=1 Tax=Portibacter marinus TaxID=2898660 RepID=UPI001F2C9970|nr:P-II family nitrogen regulator [Portibacter marinus]